MPRLSSLGLSGRTSGSPWTESVCHAAFHRLDVVLGPLILQVLGVACSLDEGWDEEGQTLLFMSAAGIRFRQGLLETFARSFSSHRHQSCGAPQRHQITHVSHSAVLTPENCEHAQLPSVFHEMSQWRGGNGGYIPFPCAKLRVLS